MADNIESVEMVDKLMTYFRNGIEPPDREIVKAYDMGINVKYLKQYIQEIENEREPEAY